MSQEKEEFVFDWDSLSLMIAKDNKMHGSISITRQDIDNMKHLHGMDMGNVLEMLVKALQTTENPNPKE